MSPKCDSKNGSNYHLIRTEKKDKRDGENEVEKEVIVDDRRGEQNATKGQMKHFSEASTKSTSWNKYNIFRRGHSPASTAKNYDADFQPRENSESRKTILMTQSDFRRDLKASEDRLLHDEDGKCFRLVEIPMNGDCGFAAIARSINISNGFLGNEKEILKTTEKSSKKRIFIPSRLTRKATSPEKESDNNRDGKEEEEKFIKPGDIRLAMSSQILKEKPKYLLDKEKYGCFYAEADYDRLLNDVIKSGISGHWLGSILGNMEHVILSHALHISIFLYQFDLQKQVVRKFEDSKVENPRHEVFLFFTGPGGSGHFDALTLVPQIAKESSREQKPVQSKQESFVEKDIGTSENRNFNRLEKI